MIIELLRISLFMSAAILLMAALSRLLHRKTSAAARMVCWLIIALNLLIPIRPAMYTLTVPAFMSSVANAATRFDERAEPEQLTEQTGEAAQKYGIISAEYAQTATGALTMPEVPMLLSYVWALGFIAVIAVCVVKHILLLRMVRRWGRPASSGAYAIMEHVAREVALKRHIPLMVSPVITTPVLIGLFRPMIVLPEGEIEDSKLRFILLHEAFHFKRGDNLAKMLSFLAVAAHWFNPLVYLMNRSLTQESEVACDMAVLRHAGADNRFLYGETVLFIAKRGKQTETALFSLFASQGNSLKRRLAGIIEGTAPKRWISVICTAVLFAGMLLPVGLTGAKAQSSDVNNVNTESTGGSPGLKDIYKNYFLIGTCGGINTLNGSYLELAAKNFNAFTFENDMKAKYVQNEEGKFCFGTVDVITAKLRKNNIAAIGHTLAWHQQAPEWMWDGREKAKERLEAHINAVVRHSGPYLTSIDVVNEVFADDCKGSGWRDDLRKDQGWYTVLGADFIEIAFREADKARREIGRPDLKLYCNDYGLNNKAKAAAVYGMVTELRAKGVPIDGIGVQSHFNQDISPDDVRRYLELFNSIPDIEVSISELDVAIESSKGNISLTAEEEALQGGLYARLFSLYKEYAKGSANPDENKRLIARVTVWGVTDAAAWRGDRNPTLFDRHFQPKSAYYAVAEPEKYLAEIAAM